jgi:hypothetical protein
MTVTTDPPVIVLYIVIGVFLLIMLSMIMKKGEKIND